MKFEWYFIKEFFTVKQCHELLTKLDMYSSDGHDVPAHGVIKTATVNTIKWSNVKNLLGGLEDISHTVNKEIFGFDLYNFRDQDMINYNIYHSENQGQYAWHKDFEINKMYDLKLTVIANISDENYSGGEFEIFQNDPIHIKEIEEPGSILIFPSFLLHRVKPVTSGIRKTVSFWIAGPKLR
jgi:PKHD-type hydroxylase